MKFNQLMAVGVVSVSGLVLSTTIAQAVEPTTLPVTSEGTVQLRDTWSEGGIIDPPTEGPEVVIPPEPKPPAGDRDLAIVYYPSFDFGFHDYDGTKSETYKASAFEGTRTNPELENDPGEDVTLPQFIQIRNSSSISKWSLQVKATDFTADDRGTPAKGDEVLKGAQMRITSITAANNTKTGGSAVAATIPSGENAYLPISNDVQTIGTYDKKGITGISRNSFIFGEVQTEEDNNGERNVTSGIELFVPANLDITKDGHYTATLTWSFANVE